MRYIGFCSRYAHAFMFDTGSTCGTVMGHSKTLNTVAIRQKRPFTVVTGGDDKSVVFSSGFPLAYKTTILDHSRYVQEVKFSHDGEMFASVGSDGKVKTGILHNRMHSTRVDTSRDFADSFRSFAPLPDDRFSSIRPPLARRSRKFPQEIMAIQELSLPCLGAPTVNNSLLHLLIKLPRFGTWRRLAWSSKNAILIY